MIEIVGEAGLNHGGSLDTAKHMVDAACIADVDVIKFQVFEPSALLHTHDPSYKMLDHLALPRWEFLNLARHCEHMDIEFLATPGDLDSLRFLVEEVRVNRLKIGSDDMTYTPLVQKAVSSGLPLIISTGMASWHEVHELIENTGAHDLTLLHCVSLYPCPIKDVNLRAIPRMRDAFDVPVGYSDHASGYRACIGAVALGACMIEKHFMLRDMQSCVDRDVSITEDELIKMVTDIRVMELMLGDGIKQPGPAELKNIPVFRKGADGRRVPAL